MIASLSSSSFNLGDMRPVLDETALLARVKSDMTFLHVVFEAFRRQYPDQRHDMRTALAANDLASVRTLAHSLKGNASTLGGSRVAEVAAEVMGASDDAASSALPDLLRRLDVEVSQFQMAMTQLLNR
jgi:HPt (histidine-containing phosphotransfer) domain-containing protein